MRFSTVFRLNTDDQQRIDAFTRAPVGMVVKEDAGLWQPDKVRMRHFEFTPVGEMNLKRVERCSFHEITDLLKHDASVAPAPSRSK